MAVSGPRPWLTPNVVVDLAIFCIAFWIVSMPAKAYFLYQSDFHRPRIDVSHSGRGSKVRCNRLAEMNAL